MDRRRSPHPLHKHTTLELYGALHGCFVAIESEPDDAVRFSQRGQAITGELMERIEPGRGDVIRRPARNIVSQRETGN